MVTQDGTTSADGPTDSIRSATPSAPAHVCIHVTMCSTACSRPAGHVPRPRGRGRARYVWSADDEFDRAVSTHREDWLRLAVIVCGGIDDAEDVLQDAILSLGAAWSRIERRGTNAYMRKIIMNKSVDMMRRRRREFPVAVVPDRPSTDNLLRFEQDRQFFDLIQRLPPLQRAALVCRYYLDLSDGETARILNCASSTVRSHIYRGLSALRRECEGNI